MTSSTASRLEGLTGLEAAKKVIRTLAQGDKGVHAVLLYGSAGSGKGELAMALAEAWLCLAPGPDGADGTCRACGAFSRGNSPDVLLIEPTGPSRIIRLHTIQEGGDPDTPVPLLTFFRTMPLMSKHKVVVIHDVDRMNATTFNSLLKTLEEPSAHAKLVLTTESVGSLPPTILSRCLAVACELPTDSELKAIFPDATEDDLRLSEGAPGRLKGILANPEQYRKIASFARRLQGRKVGEALVASEEFKWICDGIGASEGEGARAANAEALNLLATYMARDSRANPASSQLIVEAHRRIIGNGSAPIVFDALFARILALK